MSLGPMSYLAPICAVLVRGGRCLRAPGWCPCQDGHGPALTSPANPSWWPGRSRLPDLSCASCGLLTGSWVGSTGTCAVPTCRDARSARRSCRCRCCRPCPQWGELDFQGQHVPDRATGVDVGDGFQHADHGTVGRLLGDDGGRALALPRHAAGRIGDLGGQRVLPCGPHGVADGGEGDLADGRLDGGLDGLDPVRDGGRGRCCGRRGPCRL